MTPEQSAQLDHELSCWHAWQKGDKGVRGFNNRALVVGDCRGYGLQYESQLEAQYEKSDNAKYKDIDFQVSEMTEPHRTAIYINARNLSTGRTVFRSPRLPNDPVLIGVLLRFAREMLLQRLKSAGVMDA